MREILIFTGTTTIPRLNQKEGMNSLVVYNFVCKVSIYLAFSVGSNYITRLCTQINHKNKILDLLSIFTKRISSVNVNNNMV